MINDRLGWLDVVGAMQERVPALQALAVEVREAGWRDCILLGMGGSSLCPEVLRSSFGSAEGQPTLHVLDTTDPLAITRVTGADRPGPHGIHRLEQVGDNRGDALAPGAFLGADPGAR